MSASAGGTMASVSQILEEMSYGSVTESVNNITAWLDKHKKQFGFFINGKWINPESRERKKAFNPSTDQILASFLQAKKGDVDDAVQAAKNAAKHWSSTSAHVRARHLYSIARHLQKHQQLMTVLESAGGSKLIQEVRDNDIPNIIRCFYHNAGWAQLKDVEMKDWKPVGVIGIIVPWNFPIMHLSWMVAPALAMGNTVVIKPSSYTPLSSFLFAEICNEAGLPAGVVNIITGSGEITGKALVNHPDINKISFIGSLEVGREIRQSTAGHGKKLALELGGKSPMIVFESADLDSAVEGVIDGCFFNQGQVCCAASRLLIQEPVFNQFIAKLKERMTKIRLDICLEKTADMTSLISTEQLKRVKEIVENAKQNNAEVFQTSTEYPTTGAFFPPTLITNAHPGCRVNAEEVFGPVVTATSFRTAKEAVALANNTYYGLAASVWTEISSLAFEVAQNIKAGTVWINSHNLFDAASGFGGYRQSGFGRYGGKEGLYEVVIPSWQTNRRISPPNIDFKTYGTVCPCEIPVENKVLPEAGDMPRIDQTYKLYYGGAQKRPDGNSSRTIEDSQGTVIGQVSESSRKDVRNAVEAAQKAQPSWEKRSGHNKAQILYYVAENFELRKNEFIEKLMKMNNQSEEEATNEVNSSIERIFHWAAYSDKYGGTIQETNFSGTVFKKHEAVGVIGILCPDEFPLLSFVSLWASAISRGNTVIIVPSEKYPLAAIHMYQIFETSDIPGGVINILTGDRDHLARQLAEHHDVNAVWYFGSIEGSTLVEYVSACNLKRTWINYGQPRDWLIQGQGEEFLYNCNNVKNIWLPVGVTFAN